MHSLKIKHLTDATYLLTIAFAVIIDTNVSVHAENISLSHIQIFQHRAGQSIKQFLSNQSFSLSREREKRYKMSESRSRRQSHTYFRSDRNNNSKKI